MGAMRSFLPLSMSAASGFVAITFDEGSASVTAISFFNRWRGVEGACAPG